MQKLIHIQRGSWLKTLGAELMAFVFVLVSDGSVLAAKAERNTGAEQVQVEKVPRNRTSAAQRRARSKPKEAAASSAKRGSDTLLKSPGSTPVEKFSLLDVLVTPNDQVN